jgi:hypothetical protein
VDFWNQRVLATLATTLGAPWQRGILRARRVAGGLLADLVKENIQGFRFLAAAARQASSALTPDISEEEQKDEIASPRRSVRDAAPTAGGSASLLPF